MSNTRQETPLGKRLSTIHCVLILTIIFCVSESQAFATCSSSEKCDVDMHNDSALSFDQFSNSTLLFNQFSNSTLLFNQFSNSTLLFNQFSNFTHAEQNNSIIESEQLGIMDEIFENSTNQTLVPNPTQSFQFNKVNSTGNSKQNDDGSLHLQGDEYLNESSSTASLNKFTVSAWVKPDYSQGSPVFTVISDENAFMLAVNNNIPPQKIAVFSIFDGIKWTTTQSTSPIPEQWTFLTATFNGTTIQLYVNGSLEGMSTVTGEPTLVSGKLTTRLVQNITSDANVTIGAYYEKARLYTRDHFSGEISHVNLYNESLTPKQIDQVYLNTKPDGVTHHN